MKRVMSKWNIIFLVLVGTLIIVYQNCGQVRLSPRMIAAKSIPPLVVNSQIKTCTRPTDTTQRKQKVVFVLDMSLSNIGKWNGSTFSTATGTDPLGKRFDAIETYVSDCMGPNSSVAIIPFSTEVLSTSSPGFVPTSAAGPLIANLRSIQQTTMSRCPNGATASQCGSVAMASTGYRRALTALREFMFTEFNTPTATKSSYQIFFVTDGAPDDNDCVVIGGGSNAPSCYVDLIRVLPHAAVQERNSFNFISVAYGDQPIDLAVLNALTQLTGNPEAIRAPNVSDLDYCDFQEGSLKTPYASTIPTVVNLNLIVKDGIPEADSDADGVIDKDDAEPLVRHMQGGHLKKIVNELGELLPTCASPGSRWLGLNDCDRTSLSLSSTDIDSDADGILDFLEVQRGLNPNFSDDASSDVDDDGTFAWDEIHEGRNPNQFDSQLGEEKKLISTSEQLLAGSSERPSTCSDEQESWSINLQSLPLANTLEYQDSEAGIDALNLSHAKGQNILFIYYIVTPVTGEAVAEVWGVTTLVDRTTTQIQVSPEQFTKLGTLARRRN